MIRSHFAVIMLQSRSGRRDSNLVENFELSDFSCNSEALGVEAAQVGSVHPKYTRAYCYCICV